MYYNIRPVNVPLSGWDEVNRCCRFIANCFAFLRHGTQKSFVNMFGDNLELRSKSVCGINGVGCNQYPRVKKLLASKTIMGWIMKSFCDRLQYRWTFNFINPLSPWNCFISEDHFNWNNSAISKILTHKVFFLSKHFSLFAFEENYCVTVGLHWSSEQFMLRENASKHKINKH